MSKCLFFFFFFSKSIYKSSYKPKDKSQSQCHKDGPDLTILSSTGGAFLCSIVWKFAKPLQITKINKNKQKHTQPHTQTPYTTQKKQTNKQIKKIESKNKQKTKK